MCTLHETGWGTRAGISDRKFALDRVVPRLQSLIHFLHVNCCTATAALAAADKENAANGVEGYDQTGPTYTDPYENTGEPKTTYQRL
jgi:hypothetical protein